MDLAPNVHSFSDQKKLDWLISDLLEGYVATMDCPAATLTPEIMHVYPEAIVIATTRDQESWWRSMQYMNSFMGSVYLPFVVMWLWKAQAYGLWRERFRGLVNWRYGHDKIGEETLKAHEEHLRAVVPPGKLFWYDVKDGWEPLCKILNLPIPDVPFPHNNDKKSAGRVFWQHMYWGLMSWTIFLACVYFGIKYAAVLYGRLNQCF
jgi:hypothetical protein